MNQTTFIEFVKSQVAAFGSTCLDYLTFIILTEELGIWYVYSNVVGATIGAISNFLLGRKWIFKSETTPVKQQAILYALVSAGSLCLNTVGIFALTEWLNLYPIASKVFIGIIVAVCFNYPLQKYFVFKK